MFHVYIFGRLVACLWMSYQRELGNFISLNLIRLKILDHESRQALRGTMTVDKVYGGKTIVRELNELRLMP